MPLVGLERPQRPKFDPRQALMDTVPGRLLVVGNAAEDTLHLRHNRAGSKGYWKGSEDCLIKWGTGHSLLKVLLKDTPQRNWHAGRLRHEYEHNQDQRRNMEAVPDPTVADLSTLIL